MKFCSNCGTQLNDNDVICFACGLQQLKTTENTFVPPVEPIVTNETAFQPTPKKKGKKLFLVLGIVIAVLGLATLIGSLTNWFGLFTPIDKLAYAFKKTVTADDFSVKVTFDDEKYEMKTVFDKGDEDFAALISSEDYNQLYYDGTVYTDGYYYYKSDCDTEEIYEVYKDATNFDDIPWDDLIDEADLSEQLNADNSQEFCVALYNDYINNIDWMEEVMGYEVDDNVYTFEPDLKEAADDILDLVREKEIFKSKYEEDIDEFEDELKDDLRDIDDLKIEIVLDGKYVSEIKCKVKVDGETYNYKIEIFDVNKTELNEEEIDDFIEEVEEAIEEDECPDCGDRMWGEDYCWNCSSYCEECYEYYDNSDMINDYYCHDCASYCDGCNAVTLDEDLYSYSSNYYCYSCYVDKYYDDYYDDDYYYDYWY